MTIYVFAGDRREGSLRHRQARKGGLAKGVAV
jgi:hypothetical protein